MLLKNIWKFYEKIPPMELFFNDVPGQGVEIKQIVAVLLKISWKFKVFQ